MPSREQKVTFLGWPRLSENRLQTVGVAVRGSSLKRRLFLIVSLLSCTRHLHEQEKQKTKTKGNDKYKRHTVKVKESESRSVVSDSVSPWTHSPWPSPVQNTAVGSLSRLQGTFPTPGSNLGLLHCRQILYQLSHKGKPWTVVCQAPLSMEFSRQEYWSGLPFPSTGDLPNPGIKPGSPALQADSLPSEPPGKPLNELTMSSHNIQSTA